VWLSLPASGWCVRAAAEHSPVPLTFVVPSSSGDSAALVLAIVREAQCVSDFVGRCFPHIPTLHMEAAHSGALATALQLHTSVLSATLSLQYCCTANRYSCKKHHAQAMLHPVQCMADARAWPAMTVTY
jgi:hypothetical protein